MTANELERRVRAAWTGIAAPPAEDMKHMEWGWGEEAARALVGVAPIEVKIQSPGFRAATPLFDLPPRAAAAYLGTYLLSLLQSLQFQETDGLFYDIVTRAHIITCMTDSLFWQQVVRGQLPPSCQQVVADVARFMAAREEALALESEQVQTLLELAAGSNS